MPELAAVIERPALWQDTRPEDADALLRRILGAHRWLHADANAEALLAFASGDHPMASRREALAILAEWRAPSGRDRVFGNWRPVGGSQLEPSATPDAPLTFDCPPRLANGLVALAASQDNPVDLRCAAVDTVAGLGLLQLESTLTELALAPRQAPLRVRALEALDQLGAESLRPTLDKLEPSAPVAVRETAVRMLGKLDPAAAMDALGGIIENGAVRERQNALRTLARIRTQPSHDLVARLLATMRGGELPASLHLEVLEAAERHGGDKGVAEALAALQRPTGLDDVKAFEECLEGGDADKGEQLFRNHPSATCMRCHSLGGVGGDAGPALDKIGATLDRRALLEAMVQPAAKIAEGYGSIVFRLRNGETVQGIVLEESDAQVKVKDVDGKIHTLTTALIERRSTPTTSMPPMPGVLDRRQMRDIIEFLSRQK